MDAIFQYFPGGIEETYEKISVGRGSMPDDIRIEHFSNINPEFYR
jgi:hypothetical protein